jgi:hypothetical protein
MKTQKEYLVVYQDTTSEEWWLGGGCSCAKLADARKKARQMKQNPPCPAARKVAIFEKHIKYSMKELFRIK